MCIHLYTFYIILYTYKHTHTHTAVVGDEARYVTSQAHDDVTYVYDDVTYVYDDVTYVYDDVTHVTSQAPALFVNIYTFTYRILYPYKHPHTPTHSRRRCGKILPPAPAL